MQKIMSLLALSTSWSALVILSHNMLSKPVPFLSAIPTPQCRLDLRLLWVCSPLGHQAGTEASEHAMQSQACQTVMQKMK